MRGRQEGFQLQNVSSAALALNNHHFVPIRNKKQQPYQEGSKHSNGGQEMPNVVVIKERQQDAVSVVLARLCWSFLRRERKGFGLVNRL